MQAGSLRPSFSGAGRVRLGTSSYEIHLADLQRRPAAVVAAHVELPEIAEFLGGAFAEVMATLGEQGIRPAGPPFGRYVPTDGGFDVEAGFPVERAVAAHGRVVPADLPGGSVAYTVHTGAYDEVGAAYEATAHWLIDMDSPPRARAWENYLDGPEVPRPRTARSVPPVRAGDTADQLETYAPHPGRSGQRWATTPERQQVAARSTGWGSSARGSTSGSRPTASGSTHWPSPGLFGRPSMVDAAFSAPA